MISELDNAITPGDALCHFLSLAQIPGYGFFNKDVLACVERGENGIAVRSSMADNDGVYIGSRQEIVVIGVALLNPIAIPYRVKNRLVGVTDGDEFELFVFQQVRNVHHLGDCAATNYANFQGFRHRMSFNYAIGAFE
jgi:hypothetical protein